MTLSRRHFLSGTAAGLAAGSLAAPAVHAKSGSQLTFAFAPDESGAIQALIDGFNASNEAGIEITWTKAPEELDDFFRFLELEFLAGSTDIDLFGADVIWTAEFAANDWIRDVSGQVFSEIDTRDILPAALNSAYFRNRLWAVPWFTDTGMLFYRRDLLEEAGIAEPPTTWDELAEAAQMVMDGSNVANGLVLQAARYEGGTTNALEIIWSAGGRTWTAESGVSAGMGMRSNAGNAIVLNSADSVAGLAKARELVEGGVIPEDVTQMNERDALRVFGAGDAVFMRNWPFAYGLLGSEEFGPVSQDQVGIARIPTLRPGMPSYSCLGGWNLAVSRNAGNPGAAWQFVRYALAPESQRAMAETGGFLPVLESLYEDQSLRQAVPVVALGEAAVRSSRARPSSQIYSELSPRIAIMFGRVLSGELPADEAVAQTTRELRNMVSNLR